MNELLCNITTTQAGAIALRLRGAKDISTQETQIINPPPNTFAVRLQTFTLQMPYDHFRVASRNIWLDWHTIDILKPSNVKTPPHTE
jgi:hypothetical protein